MRRFWAGPFVAAALALASVSAHAEVEFGYENFQRTRTGAAEIVLKFTNGTQRHIDSVAADCALLSSENRAITTIVVTAQNIPPNDYAYGKNYGPQDDRIERADCRIRSVRPSD